MSDLIFTDDAAREIYNVQGFPLGLAIIGYLGSGSKENKAGYIVMEKFRNKLPMRKAQRTGELKMIGRNDPALQMFGGDGLRFDSCEAVINGENAHDTVLQFAGLCDAGNPVWFACDKWLRKVVIIRFDPKMITHNTRYDVTFDLIKFEQIDPLSYARSISDLAPFPSFSDADIEDQKKQLEDTGNPADKKIENKGEYKEIKGSDGTVIYKVPKTNTCRMVTIPKTAEGSEETWESLIYRHYGQVSADDIAILKNVIKSYNYSSSNIYDSDFGEDPITGRLKPIRSFSVCFPTEIILPGPPEKKFAVK